MNLVIIWICFIFLMTMSKRLDQTHYVLFSSLMLYFTYLYNKIQPIRMSLRISSCLLSIPSVIFWYIIFVYNDFLSLKPITFEALVGLLFVYVYLIAYVFWECP